MFSEHRSPDSFFRGRYARHSGACRAPRHVRHILEKPQHDVCDGSGNRCLYGAAAGSILNNPDKCEILGAAEGMKEDHESWKNVKD